jgi:hypothetical protein
MLREATYPPAAVNVLDVSSESMAAFQVFMYGRFWVFTEADGIADRFKRTSQRDCEGFTDEVCCVARTLLGAARADGPNTYGAFPNGLDAPGVGARELFRRGGQTSNPRDPLSNFLVTKGLRDP